MSIQEHLNKIRNAIYGREVRESIAKGIETAYNDASENGNANMEVKIARGTYPNLRSRLDDTTAKLAQKVGGGKKAELENLSSTVLSAIEGGEHTSFDLLSIPQDKSVAVGKTDFINEGVNKLNLHDKDFVEGGFLNGDGQLTVLNGYFTTGFIPVKNGDVVRYAYDLKMGSNNKLHFFDIDKKILASTPVTEFPHAYDYREETVDLEGVHYLGVSYTNDMKDSAMVTINTPYPDNYVPYKNQLDESFVLNETQINFVLDTMSDFINEGVNKLNLHDKDLVEGAYLGATGRFVDLDGYFTTGFIPVKNGDVVRYTYELGMGSNNKLHFYDTDKKLLYSTPTTEYPHAYDYREETVDLEGVHYLRVSYLNDVKDSVMVTINTPYPDNYVPHSHKLAESFVLNETQINFILDNLPELNIKNPLANKVVSFNGDSISAGAGYTGGYGKIIAEQNNMIYENISVGGGTLTAEQYNQAGNERHWVSRTISNMREDSDYIIIQGGVNDGSLGVPIGEVTTGYTEELDDTTFCGALESICKQVLERFPGKKIGYVFVHYMTTSQKTYAPYIYEILEKWGIPYCDLYKNVPPLNYIAHLKQSHTKDNDGWHPNEKGYRDYYVPKIESWMKTL